jgi:hypothetical protein
MSDILIMSVFVITPAIVFLFLLWAPTFFVVIRQKQSKYTRSRIYAYALPVELVVAASLAFLVDWVGLLNPAAYAIVITLTTGVLGAIGVHHFTKISVVSAVSASTSPRQDT